MGECLPQAPSWFSSSPRKNRDIKKPTPEGRVFLSGSPYCSIDRTFQYTFIIPIIERPNPRVPKVYKNPIFLALEYQAHLKSGECSTQPDLARLLGTSRMRVNQILRLLQLNPQIIQVLQNLGDPLPSHRITERMLRTLINQPLKQQVAFLRMKGVAFHVLGAGVSL